MARVFTSPLLLACLLSRCHAQLTADADAGTGILDRTGVLAGAPVARDKQHSTRGDFD